MFFEKDDIVLGQIAYYAPSYAPNNKYKVWYGIKFDHDTITLGEFFESRIGVIATLMLNRTGTSRHAISVRPYYVRKNDLFGVHIRYTLTNDGEFPPF